MMIEDELRDLGYSSFEIACTEGEALEAAARNAPDLVTSDGLLVGESGPAAVRRIRASLEVPLIFITGDPARARDCVPGAPILKAVLGTATCCCGPAGKNAIFKRSAVRELTAPVSRAAGAALCVRNIT
jgi:CheY-like chemotaxis protein